MNDTIKQAINPEMVAGPYYGGGGEYRSDIRDGQPGIDLDLTISIINVDNGEAVVGIDVDLWHCNASGAYSGFDADPDAVPTDLSDDQIPTNDERFLRGRQTTNDKGEVTFKTIYPSWYVLRTPHIHVKLFEEDVCTVTTQFYLADSMTKDILENKPAYARRAERDTFNHTDPVIATSDGSFDNSWVDLKTGEGGFIGTATIYIKPGEVNDPIISPDGQIPPKGGRPHNVPVK